MARYIRTKLRIEADPERIGEIVRMLEGDGSPIDFGRIIPLQNEDEMSEKWGIDSGPEEIDLIVYRNGTVVEYSFDTEKKIPLKIYEQTARMFPDVRIVISYAFEDYGYDCGIYESEKGSSGLVYKEPDDPFVFACDVWEVDPDEARNEEMINFYEE